jgi:hypothetical protein
MEQTAQLELFPKTIRGLKLVECKNLLGLPKGLLREYCCSVDDAIKLYRQKFQEKPAKVYVLGIRVFIPLPSPSKLASLRLSAN